MKSWGTMKKVTITVSVLLCIFVATISFFYIRFINLDTYKWNANEDIISFGDKQYRCEQLGAPLDIKLGKQVGKVERESSFRIWEVRGEDVDERIALTGFMFPSLTYRRIR